jgi:hypothetical protein
MSRFSFARTAVLGAAVLSLAFIGATPAHAAGVPGDDAFLDTAADFSVIAGSTVTNTGPSILDKSLAVSPGTATPGFPPGIILGERHSADAVAIQAQLDLTTAANAIMAVPSYDVGSADLDGLTFQAGAYSSATSLMNNGTITLNGDADDVFIFTAVSTLTTGSGSTIAFTGGAQECNVFWRVGSSATLGTGSHFAGTIIAQASVSATTLATISGRLFAQTAAVTLQSNVFTAPTCDETGGDGVGVVPGETPPEDNPAGPTGPVLPIPEDETDGGGEGEGDGSGITPAAVVPTLAATGEPVAATSVLLIGSVFIGAGVLLFGARRRRNA